MTALPMPPGEYWIGDPCYAVPHDDWPCFLHTVRVNGQPTVFNGAQCAVFRTTKGDGSYRDQEGRLYSIDSGMIAAMPADCARNNPDQVVPNSMMGAYVTFDQHFDFRHQPDGAITFGHVTINIT